MDLTQELVLQCNAIAGNREQGTGNREQGIGSLKVFCKMTFLTNLCPNLLGNYYSGRR
jgi:hypothetical protein